MKPCYPAVLALLGWYLICPPLSSAQSNTKTFTDPDGAFSFRYWDNLIRCPADECNAYHPTCDEILAPENSQEQTSVVCLAYPKNKFTDTPAYESATFSVEIVNHKATKASCLAPPEGAYQPGTTKINGISFKTFEIGDAGMNQGVDVRAYRTFYNGKCYQLGVNVATAIGEVFDPPVRNLTDTDLREINGKLDQPLRSFRFLK